MISTSDMVRKTAIGSLVPDSNSNNGLALPLRCMLRVFKIENTAAASVDETTAPNKRLTKNDRFLMKILVTYPSRADLSKIVERTISREEVHVNAALDAASILEVRAVCREVLVAPHVQDYAIELVMATQPDNKDAPELSRKYIRYGSSPRGAQALVECGRVLALMRGRFHLSTEDIRAVATSVLRHRVILNFDAHADGQSADTVLSSVLRSVAAHAAA